MKKVIGNSVVCIGKFGGPDIEEGTFHKEETATDVSHKSKTQQCPCPPAGSHEAKVPEESNENTEKDTGKND